MPPAGCIGCPVAGSCSFLLFGGVRCVRCCACCSFWSFPSRCSLAFFVAGGRRLVPVVFSGFSGFLASGSFAGFVGLGSRRLFVACGGFVVLVCVAAVRRSRLGFVAAFVVARFRSVGCLFAACSAGSSAVFRRACWLLRVAGRPSGRPVFGEKLQGGRRRKRRGASPRPLKSPPPPPKKNNRHRKNNTIQ